jgi:hypothetical protein
MTWGQLRFQLQIFGPGVSGDLLDAALNSRYEQVLEATDWSGMEAHATIQTTAGYQSGADTVTLRVGSADVAGSGTAFGAATVGMRFYRPGDTAIYTVIPGTTANLLTLDRPYEGNSGAAAGTVYTGAAYVLMQNVYALPADVRSISTVLDPVVGLPLEKFSKDQLDASAGLRTLVDDPRVYAAYDDSDEANPPVLKQIEFYPPPLMARGYLLAYLRAAAGFDGSATGSSPLPFVSDTVLLYGCRADIAAHLANEAARGGDAAACGAHLMVAKAQEAKYQEELAKLLRVEHCERRPRVALRMANRFTRHRMARASRGLRRIYP